MNEGVKKLCTNGTWNKFDQSKKVLKLGKRAGVDGVTRLTVLVEVEDFL